MYRYSIKAFVVILRMRVGLTGHGVKDDVSRQSYSDSVFPSPFFDHSEYRHSQQLMYVRSATNHDKSTN